MEWININDKKPEAYQEVIISSNEGKVKSAIYIGNGKWSTFLPIVYWMPYPSPPDGLMNKKTSIEAPKKKRGRPKKS